LKTVNENKTNNGRYVILRLIDTLLGIRYNDLARITKLNNGVISHFLNVLEKNSLIKTVRCSNGKITRYYSSSISSDHYLIIGYLKSETARRIILFLYFNNRNNFEEIRIHIKRTTSTTSWNLKRLVVDNVILKSRDKKQHCYAISNPTLVTRVLENSDYLLMDGDIDIGKLHIQI